LHPLQCRIYQGIHWRFADEAARHQGRQVGRWAYKQLLRLLHGKVTEDDESDDDYDDQGHSDR
jgi:hypothetical protein